MLELSYELVFKQMYHFMFKNITIPNNAVNLIAFSYILLDFKL